MSKNSTIQEHSFRTHTCADLREDHVGQSVTLCGWVNKSRDLGGLHFKDIRDKYGITQLNFSQYKGDFNPVKQTGLESTIKVSGLVRPRPADALNRKMSTGMIEVIVHDYEVLSYSDKDNIPFLPMGAIEAGDDLRLKYRYLDLRTSYLQNILKLRSDAAKTARECLYEENFVEVETPILYKTTPEGARDYIVPSRVHPGKVYALPQSPQTLKQLLMIGGTDRYFQIVKCFRDEDLRADRQPEFSQIDIEVSFAGKDFLRALAEKMTKRLFKLEDNFSLETMTYAEAMRDYGSDKPDLRFGLKHITVTDLFEQTEFKVFADVIENGMIKSLFIPESKKKFSRKEIDSLVEIVRPYGGKGVAWFKSLENNERSGGISKFISDEIFSQLRERETENNEKKEGIWFFIADLNKKVVHASTDALRRYFAKTLNLYEKDYAFKFIIDFPLLDYDEDEKRFVACHHPFTQPHPDDLEKFLTGDPEDIHTIRADAYDLVCNGYELAGGSVRIYQDNVQNRMFQLLGFSEEEKQHKFGFFLEALRYGVPPHAGIAFGFDRLIMLMAKTDNIKDSIAFPKTATASDLMSNTPSTANKDQIKELHFKWLSPEK